MKETHVFMLVAYQLRFTFFLKFKRSKFAFFTRRKILFVGPSDSSRAFRRRYMCWLLTYFLVLIQNEFRVICDWLKKICSCLFVGPKLPYLFAQL